MQLYLLHNLFEEFTHGTNATFLEKLSEVIFASLKGFAKSFDKNLKNVIIMVTHMSKMSSFGTIIAKHSFIFLVCRLFHTSFRNLEDKIMNMRQDDKKWAINILDTSFQHQALW